MTSLDKEGLGGWETFGVKYDQGKPRFDLIDAYATEELAKVLTFGAAKYAEENWRKGISFKRLIAAAKRHINAIEQGEYLDSETKLPHAAHAMCCMMFLTWMQKNRPDMDDRWKTEKERAFKASWDRVLAVTANAAAQYKITKGTASNLILYAPYYGGRLNVGQNVCLKDRPGVWAVAEVIQNGRAFSLRSTELNPKGEFEIIIRTGTDIRGVLL